MREIKKFWMTKFGKVGTAHEDREGRVVDFRPAKVVPLACSPYGAYRGEVDDDTLHMHVVLRATDGTGATKDVFGPVVWGPWGSGRYHLDGFDYETRQGTSRVLEMGVVVYDGPVPVKRVPWQARGAPGQEAKVQALLIAREEAKLKKQHQKALLKESPLVGLTPRDIGRLRRFGASKRTDACENVIRRWSEYHKFAAYLVVNHEEALRWVLEADDARRDAKKAAWLSRAV